MAQDIDVARVAAALRAPVIRYRNFGNEPVRGTFQEEETVAAADMGATTPALEAALAEAAALQQSTPGENESEIPTSCAPEVHAPQVALFSPIAVGEEIAKTETQPEVVFLAAPQAPARPGARTMAEALREAAAKVAPAVAQTPPPEVPLAELLRISAAEHPPVREGLLGLLAQPPSWADDPAEAPHVLTGQPIVPVDPGAGGLLSPAGSGLVEPPARPAEPSRTEAPRPQVPVLPVETPPAPLREAAFVAPAPQVPPASAEPPPVMPEPPPPAAAPQAKTTPVPAPLPATWAAAQRPTPAAQDAPRPSGAKPAPSARAASLSDVFRLVKAPPPQPASRSKQTESLQSVLRGLRPAQRD
ncbi:hypothetical protein HMPREF9946_00454 [Acetobacteraceae bacterium AT-5844]|nr:hypothetical protein HMPREF9946_00454 [Acetobacteraceae bacterium AT-5844]